MLDGMTTYSIGEAKARLSVAAVAVFQLAETGNATLVVPAIVVAEFYYLSAIIWLQRR